MGSIFGASAFDGTNFFHERIFLESFKATNLLAEEDIFFILTIMKPTFYQLSLSSFVGKGDKFSIFELVFINS